MLLPDSLYIEVDGLLLKLLSASWGGETTAQLAVLYHPSSGQRGQAHTGTLTRAQVKLSELSYRGVQGWHRAWATTSGHQVLGWRGRGGIGGHRHLGRQPGGSRNDLTAINRANQKA